MQCPQGSAGRMGFLAHSCGCWQVGLRPQFLRTVRQRPPSVPCHVGLSTEPLTSGSCFVRVSKRAREGGANGSSLPRVTACHCGCTLFLRSKPLGPAHTQELGMTQAVTTRGHGCLVPSPTRPEGELHDSRNLLCLAQPTSPGADAQHMFSVYFK